MANLDLVISITKYSALVASLVLAMVGLLGTPRDDEKRLTKAGKVTLLLLVVAFVISVSASVAEELRGRQSAEAAKKRNC